MNEEFQESAWISLIKHFLSFIPFTPDSDNQVNYYRPTAMSIIALK